MTVLALVGGVGTLAFWGWGLLVGGVAAAPEPWPGFRRHELAFVVPDGVVAIGLLVAASGVAPAAAPRVVLVCAGGLLFLGLLDLSYLALTWGRRSGLLRLRTTVVAAAALSLGLYFALATPLPGSPGIG